MQTQKPGCSRSATRWGVGCCSCGFTPHSLGQFCYHTLDDKVGGGEEGILFSPPVLRALLRFLHSKMIPSAMEKRVVSFQPGSWKSLQTFKITIIFAVAKQSFKRWKFLLSEERGVLAVLWFNCNLQLKYLAAAQSLSTLPLVGWGVDLEKR